MEELHKEHLIRSGARQFSTGKWKTTVEVCWVEAEKDQVKRWREWDFEQSYLSEIQAEMEGIFFARQWINSKKP